MFGFFAPKSKIINLLPEVRGDYIENAKLSKHTWFGVGGPAEVLFLPKDVDDLKTETAKIPDCKNRLLELLGQLSEDEQIVVIATLK